MVGIEVFEGLLLEAKQSPNLLADLAALEGYLSETYSNRAFIELLQNADDAGATQVHFIFDGQQLLCSNNGKAFTPEDVQGLCRSGKSSKTRGTSIGYRGIGFKSTAALASEILVSSGDYCFKFSRELTAKALSSKEPMPLIRVPHFGAQANADWSELQTRHPDLVSSNTTFAFDVKNFSALELEFENFRADYLLFLKNVLEVRLSFKNSARSFFRSTNSHASNLTEVTLTSSDAGDSEWLIINNDSFSIACASTNNLPTPLRQEASLFHSFLPTNETTGLGVRINADFSTDPSRTKITLDEHTMLLLESIATYLAQRLVAVALGDRDDIGRALTPDNVQGLFVQSNKSVRAVLAELLRTKVQKAAELSGFRSKPAWAEGIQLDLLAESAKSAPRLVQPMNEEQAAFLRSCGLKPLSPSELAQSYDISSLSRDGVTALLGQLVSTAALLNTEDIRKFTEAPIWETENGVFSCDSCIASGAVLTKSFVDALASRGVSTVGLKTLLKRVDPRFGDLLGPTVANPEPINQNVNGWKVLGSAESSRFAQQDLPADTDEPMWRTAELLVLTRLRQAGFEANDVSRQFVGYDIHAKLNGREYFVEVKKLSHFGEPFSLTSNEQAFAMQSGENFVIALVCPSNDGSGANLAFIGNPAAKLQYERQCQKWVWECSSYKEHLQESIS